MKIEFRRSDAILKGMPEGTRVELVIECEDFVQLTYDSLRLGPEGEFAAHIDRRGGWIIEGDPLPWSDIVISP
jgi:hypothetical protein